MTMRCSQCGSAAARCDRCSSALCERRLCAEVHDAACEVLSALPSPARMVSFRTGTPAGLATFRPPKPRRERNPEAERVICEYLVSSISQHRHAGRAALLAGELDTAFDELWTARQLEPDLDRLGASARDHVPPGWELETDLAPLARALSARPHPRAADAWRIVLDDRPARSVQAEAAEALARDAFAGHQPRAALRILHAASLAGRGADPNAFHAAYRQAGVDPAGAFGLYLAASRVDPRTARAMAMRDPLTDATWPDQDARWWARASDSACAEVTDHQAEALGRARDLARTRRDEGWLMLAEGDYAAGPLGARELGRNVRAGRAEPADEDAFVRIRLAYEGAAQRLPDMAWAWYRLAELLAWAGFAEPAAEHLAQAERRGLGTRDAEWRLRPVLRALVQVGLGHGPSGMPTAARPSPAEPFGQSLAWRLRLR